MCTSTSWTSPHVHKPGCLMTLFDKIVLHHKKNQPLPHSQPPNGRNLASALRQTSVWSRKSNRPQHKLHD